MAARISSDINQSLWRPRDPKLIWEDVIYTLHALSACAPTSDGVHANAKLKKHIFRSICDREASGAVWSHSMFQLFINILIWSFRNDSWSPQILSYSPKWTEITLQSENVLSESNKSLQIRAELLFVLVGMINILHGLGLRFLALGHHTPFMVRQRSR